MPFAVWEHLRRGVVVCHSPADDRPHESASLVVDIDNQFARDDSVPKRYDPCSVFEANIGDEARCQAPMESSDIS
jgi:hypothetical protein